ncbi:MAG TPA: HU family DNA-binding protein [Candidatus Binataceae bacterium]|nr:HU family DNA-binding protein [Candidatus Binataceae bacterium]
MTKSQIIESVAEATHQPKSAVAETFQLIFDSIGDAIVSDKRFWVPGFGTFSVRRRRERPGVNPRTNAKMSILAASTIGFRPAPKLKKGL